MSERYEKIKYEDKYTKMLIGRKKFSIAINLRLLQEQEVFGVPGCSRLTSLLAANFQIFFLLAR